MQSLFHRAGVAGCLDVDITAITVGQLAYLIDGIDFTGVDSQVRATSLGQIEPLVVEVEGDQQPGIFAPRRRKHAQAQRPGASDHHDIVQLDLPALHGMNRTGEGFNKDGVFLGEGVGHFVVNRVGRELHIVRHCAKGFLAETVDIVDLAHPILPALTIATFPAGGDLLGKGGITQGEAIFFARPSAQRHHGTDKFMAGDHWWLRIANAIFITPEKGRAGITLEVTGTDADRIDLDYYFMRARFRNPPLLQPIILRSMTDHRRHRLG